MRHFIAIVATLVGSGAALAQCLYSPSTNHWYRTSAAGTWDSAEAEATAAEQEAKEPVKQA